MSRYPRHPIRRRRAAALLLAPAVAACVPGAPAGGQPAPAGTSGGALRVQPVVPNTDLAVGPNRFTLGVLNVSRGTTTPVPVPDATLALRFFHPIEPQPVPKGEATPEFRYVGDKSKGLYVAQLDFDQPGDWGVEVNGTVAGQPLTTTRVRFTVKPESATPAVGAPVPRSHNPTRYDVADVRQIDSGATPNDMHEVSIAGALERGKPLVALFASPGFCVTQTCAPQLGEVQRLQARYGARASFVHVEIFKDPATRAPFEAVLEWGLNSEPWTFLVDRHGLLAAKFEGPAPFAELDAALQPLL